MKYLYLGLGVGLLASIAASAQAHNYLGAKRCESCHEFAYQTWLLGPHSNADETLKGEQATDPKCTTCHSMVSVAERDERYAGVQCESCHGAGRYYYPDYVMRDRELARAVGLVEQGQEVCTHCHTAGAPSLEAFDYTKMWAQIAHGAKEREAWENRQRGSKEKGAGYQETPGKKTAQR